jgi:N-acetylneuraminate synthase
MGASANIAGRRIGEDSPTYFIADIAANHDGDIEKAKELIHMCAEGGADAAKFQNFTAEKIVSDYGFKNLGSQMSHQSKWKKSVSEVYADASIPHDWSPVLKETCDKAGIHYFSSPYDFEAVDMLDAYVPAYKIGSGDITWHEMLEYIASKGKPVILACGASNILEVQLAVDCILKQNKELLLMQCNTNYTASVENFKYINLKVLETLKAMYPSMVLGLSDHTPGHSTVLGAIALGARIVEKHFTNDTTQVGPDHAFSMDPTSWREMVDRTRELEAALGIAIKKIEDNEKDTVVLQRRAVRAVSDMAADTVIDTSMLEVLRPCPHDAVVPYDMHKLIGKKLQRAINAGEHLKFEDVYTD